MSRGVREKRLVWAAGLIVVGLAVQAVSLYGVGPRSFLAFALVGGVLVAAGVAVSLMAILGRGRRRPGPAAPAEAQPDDPPA